MTTLHMAYSSCGIEHVLTTYRTIRVQQSLDTLVSVLEVDVQTRITFLHRSLVRSEMETTNTLTYLAVEEVLPKPSSNPANATIGAVVNAPVRIVVPEFADGAVIHSGCLPTTRACLTHSLSRTAVHAKHVLRVLCDHGMVLSLIMTETTRVPVTTHRTLGLDVPLVMLTT